MSVEPDHSAAVQPQPDQEQTTMLSHVDDGQPLNIRFGRYLLLRDIGEGAMGTVYTAEQDEPARTVAVKVMKSKPASVAAEARFIRESRLLATLNHPHVAQLYDAGIHREGVIAAPYCVMELVRGASSITAFAEARKLTTKQRIELFLQVCAGVRHVHEHQILHCDLKPSNILVNEAGHVKVIDFGVARSMQLDEQGGTVWSDASLLFGTPQYMSPEQVQGHNFELDARSDVYALGVVLYELLCDQLPYKVDRTSSITAARSILESDPLAPRRIDRSLPFEVDVVLLKALSKDASRRYANVASLESDLRRLLAGEPVEGESQRWYRTRRKTERWVARHRLFATTIAVLSCAGIVGLVAARIADLGLNHAFDLFLVQDVRHVGSAPLAHVVLVKITERTDLVALAGHSLTDTPEDLANPRLGRRAHGAFLKRLSQARVRPRAITFDIWFPPDSPWDADLAEGIRAVSNTPVVVVARGGSDGAGPMASVAPLVRPHVFAGSTLGLMRGDGPWSANLATSLSNGGVFPSLALMTASQCWHPRQTPAMSWSPDAIALRYAGGVERRVPVTSVAEMPDEDNEEMGIRKGSPFAEFVVEIPDDHALAGSSIDYRDVFTGNDEEIRARLDGKVLLIGDFRADADGPFPHPDGRRLPGAVLHAVAIDRLLAGRALLRPRFLAAGGAYVTSEVPIALGATLLGAALARASRRRRLSFRLLAYAISAAAIVGIALLCFRIGGFMYLPIAPVMCLVIGAEVMRLVSAVRESTV